MTQQLFPSRRFWFYGGLVAVLMMAALTLPARAKRPHPRRHDEYKHQVEKLEDVWRAAQLSGDVTAIDQMLADDYVGITMSGQMVTKTQQLDRMRKRTMVLSTYDLTDRKVKLIGTTAVVTSLAEIEGSNEGKPIHGTFRSTRVYTRMPSGIWKVTNFEATRVGPGQRAPVGVPEHGEDPKP
jgi:ketosteroid isomerase-like protein